MGDIVWDDNGAGGGTAGDGIQNGSEAGVDGIMVTLLNSDGSATGKTDTTADGGQYGFTDLVPGDYIIQFSDLADGYGFSPMDAVGTEATDSDVNPAGANAGKTNVFTLNGGDNNVDIDAGINNFASLGNLVWNDTNENGVQDAGEGGINGITVSLLDNSGNPVAGKETTTANGGQYSFMGLIPGDYKVKFSLPSNHKFSPKNTGDEVTDSDVDTSTGITDTITLIAGETNTTVDAGIYDDTPPSPPPPPAPSAISSGMIKMQTGCRMPGSLA
ncbi:Serine-aspartate repeat-containing protein F precursor [Candidatus Venteria ishoeyi]|uniref:Serine-aspartate repeat-containing protein F n=1 Tax=Candidatus Venteria ishoeyi TaxID=1899563 RepID=A0A1H6FB77_9GAMM|nr:Serine-aspartate repeat-containing protein F precursor [Candidatus Venteria ishoeyi]